MTKEELEQHWQSFADDTFINSPPSNVIRSTKLGFLAALIVASRGIADELIAPDRCAIAYINQLENTVHGEVLAMLQPEVTEMNTNVIPFKKRGGDV